MSLKGEKAGELLLAITRCPALAEARDSRSHRCSTIVRSQCADGYHVPEPWSGHIDTAPILFLSSNPSLNEHERFPTSDWSADDTTDYFMRRFDEDAGHIDRKKYNSVRFWTSVRARAREILGRDVTPGMDFALTEVVHCKSRQEEGVVEAMEFCAGKWLDAILSHAGARVIVVLGKPAKETCLQQWKLGPNHSVHFDVVLGGRPRAVLFLPHPNAFERKTVKRHTSESELARLREVVRG